MKTQNPLLPIQLTGATPAPQRSNANPEGAAQFSAALSREIDQRKASTPPAPAAQPPARQAAPANAQGGAPADKPADAKPADAKSADAKPADTRSADGDDSGSAASVAKSDLDANKNAEAAAATPVADMLALVASFNPVLQVVQPLRAAAPAESKPQAIAALGVTAGADALPQATLAVAGAASSASVAAADATAALAPALDPAAAAASPATLLPAAAKPVADAAPADPKTDAASVAALVEKLTLPLSAALATKAAPVAAAPVPAAAIPLAVDSIKTRRSAEAPAAVAAAPRADASVTAPPTAPVAAAAEALAAPGAAKPQAEAAPLADAKPQASEPALAAAPKIQADSAVPLRTRDAAPEPLALREAPLAVAAPALAVPQAGLNLAPVVNATGADKISARVGTPGWDNQVGQKIVWMVAGKEQSASLTLNPPDMGPMQVVLSVTNDQASITFSSAQPEVRQALENAMPRLREMMSDNGISLGNATVNAGMPDQRQAQGEQQQRSATPGGARFDTNGSASEAAARVAARPVTPGTGRGQVDTFA
ncbi:MAG: flagellar hook-length control protein FliK [Pseudomonadota bacterium]